MLVRDKARDSVMPLQFTTRKNAGSGNSLLARILVRGIRYSQECWSGEFTHGQECWFGEFATRRNAGPGNSPLASKLGGAKSPIDSFSQLFKFLYVIRARLESCATRAHKPRMVGSPRRPPLSVMYLYGTGGKLDTNRQFSAFSRTVNVQNSGPTQIFASRNPVIRSLSARTSFLRVRSFSGF